MAEDRPSPWEQAPERRKKLAHKRAERLARRAEYWGKRLEAARQIGPEAVASLTFDRVRGDFDRLDGERRERAYLALAQALNAVREAHAE
ncbi:hypothetical protein [Streptomyces sp. WMMB303]|uniref:hypothetical protein n=1 Tax=Streptomyces sp. WMMB303 TaxID=3034154 RepID=UPI0023ED1319|nr:hypothetical protein [Streptomyces sp. WMMB303]MDF4254625.1 hypothetical protein [Streptomyces sp. WMMB303]